MFRILKEISEKKNSFRNNSPRPGFEPGPSARGRCSAAELSQLFQNSLISKIFEDVKKEYPHIWSPFQPKNETVEQDF